MQNAHQDSDEYLRKEIFSAFEADNRIDCGSLRVGVLNAIAHLAGEVDSLSKRTLAEKLAKQINGIRGVVNRIEAPGAPSPARKVNLNLNK